MDVIIIVTNGKTIISIAIALTFVNTAIFYINVRGSKIAKSIIRKYN